MPSAPVVAARGEASEAGISAVPVPPENEIRRGFDACARDRFAVGPFDPHAASLGFAEHDLVRFVELKLDRSDGESRFECADVDSAPVDSAQRRRREIESAGWVGLGSCLDRIALEVADWRRVQHDLDTGDWFGLLVNDGAGDFAFRHGLRQQDGREQGGSQGQHVEALLQKRSNMTSRLAGLKTGAQSRKVFRQRSSLSRESFSTT